MGENYQVPREELLLYKGRWNILNVDDFNKLIMDEFHTRPYTSHLGYQNMIKATKKYVVGQRWRMILLKILLKIPTS